MLAMLFRRQIDPPASIRGLNVCGPTSTDGSSRGKHRRSQMSQSTITWDCAYNMVSMRFSVWRYSCILLLERSRLSSRLPSFSLQLRCVLQPCTHRRSNPVRHQCPRWQATAPLRSRSMFLQQPRRDRRIPHRRTSLLPRHPMKRRNRLQVATRRLVRKAKPQGAKHRAAKPN